MHSTSGRIAYYYAVRAVKGALTGAGSNVVNTAVPVSAPTSAAASVSGANVSLTWSSVSGADSYQVLRSLSAVMFGSTTLTSATNSYSDTPARGYTYYCQVKTVKGALVSTGSSTTTAAVSPAVSPAQSRAMAQ